MRSPGLYPPLRFNMVLIPASCPAPQFACQGGRIRGEPKPYSHQIATWSPDFRYSNCCLKGKSTFLSSNCGGYPLRPSVNTLDIHNKQLSLACRLVFMNKEDTWAICIICIMLYVIVLCFIVVYRIIMYYIIWHHIILYQRISYRILV